MHVVCALVSRLTRILVNKHANYIAVMLEPAKESLNGLSPQLPEPFHRYLSHEPAKMFGRADELHCACCTEAIADGCVLKCDACHRTDRNSGVFHPTCARACDFQLIWNDAPQCVTAACPVHFDTGRFVSLQVGSGFVCSDLTAWRPELPS